jgi:hypothetical protein
MQMIRRLHHVGIVTANIEAALSHYVEVFECEMPRILSVDKLGIKLRTAMLSIGESHLQLIDPENGPGVDDLKKGGEGAIIEMALEVSDIEEMYDKMKARNIEPVSIVGEPIPAKFLVASSGNRYFYLPKDKMRGTSIEIYQVMLQKPSRLKSKRVQD